MNLPFFAPAARGETTTAPDLPDDVRRTFQDLLERRLTAAEATKIAGMTSADRFRLYADLAMNKGGTY